MEGILPKSPEKTIAEVLAETTMNYNPRQSFMVKQGFPVEAADHLYLTDNGRAFLTYNSKDIKEFKEPTEDIDLEKIKKEDLAKKIGGLFSIYVKNIPAENATPEDFLQSMSKLYDAFRMDNISKKELYSADGKNLYKLDDILYQDAYTFLIDKYCLSKIPRLEQMLKEYNITDDFALEADISVKDVFGKKVYHVNNFILYIIGNNGESAKHKLENYEDVAYALTIHKFDNFLFTDLEAKKEENEEFEALLAQFKAKFNSGRFK